MTTLNSDDDSGLMLATVRKGVGDSTLMMRHTGKLVLGPCVCPSLPWFGLWIYHGAELSVEWNGNIKIKKKIVITSAGVSRLDQPEPGESGGEQGPTHTAPDPEVMAEIRNAGILFDVVQEEHEDGSTEATIDPQSVRFDPDSFGDGVNMDEGLAGEIAKIVNATAIKSQYETSTYVVEYGRLDNGDWDETSDNGGHDCVEAEIEVRQGALMSATADTQMLTASGSWPFKFHCSVACIWIPATANEAVGADKWMEQIEAEVAEAEQYKGLVEAALNEIETDAFEQDIVDTYTEKGKAAAAEKLRSLAADLRSRGIYAVMNYSEVFPDFSDHEGSWNFNAIYDPLHRAIDAAQAVIDDEGRRKQQVEQWVSDYNRILNTAENRAWANARLEQNAWTKSKVDWPEKLSGAMGGEECTGEAYNDMPDNVELSSSTGGLAYSISVSGTVKFHRP